MDRRIFLALMTIATAETGSPALAQQLRSAETAQSMKLISIDDLMKAIYRLSLAPNGAKVAVKALMHLRYSKAEAAQITETARMVAAKAGSYEVFKDVIEGKTQKRVAMTPSQTAMLRSVITTHEGRRAQPPGSAEALWGFTWAGAGAD